MMRHLYIVATVGVGCHVCRAVGAHGWKMSAERLAAWDEVWHFVDCVTNHDAMRMC